MDAVVTAVTCRCQTQFKNVEVTAVRNRVKVRWSLIEEWIDAMMKKKATACGSKMEGGRRVAFFEGDEGC